MPANRLEKYNYNHQDEGVDKTVRILKRAKKLLGIKKSVDSIRGLEGRAAAVYFRGFGQCLRQPDMAFTGRNRRPPRDPVNSLLSFGYTLLAGEAVSALQSVGLHPGIGFLHTSYHRRPALALDLVESLRSPVVDRMILRIVNKRMLTADDFVHTSDGVLLEAEARKQFLAWYEEAVICPLTLAGAKETGAREWLRQEAMRLKRCIADGEYWCAA